MVQKFGISVDEPLADRIERPLGYGDSRSERIRELVLVGLAVEEAGDMEQYRPDDDALW